jgi:hypothetical protein
MYTLISHVERSMYIGNAILLVHFLECKKKVQTLYDCFCDSKQISKGQSPMTFLSLEEIIGIFVVMRKSSRH